MSTKTTFFKSKLCKIIGTILFLALLARISEALVFMSFFFIIFVLIFRSNIKYKEKTGSWPTSTYSPFVQPSSKPGYIGSAEWNANPIMPGSGAWHVLNDHH